MIKVLTLNMNNIYIKNFRGQAWLAIHEPCLANYTLVKIFIYYYCKHF